MAGQTVHLAFSAEQAADLSGATKRQLSYWDRSDFFSPRFVVDGRRVYSFRDVVGLRTIKLLRDRGISLQKLRRVSPWIHQHSETPWASLAIFVFRNDVYFRDPATRVVESADDVRQGVVIELDQVANEIKDRLAERQERDASTIGRISRTRAVMRNQPVIAGTRVRTEAIWHFHEDGFSNQEILEQYPSLKPEDIQAAIDFERGRREQRAS